MLSVGTSWFRMSVRVEQQSSRWCGGLQLIQGEGLRLFLRMRNRNTSVHNLKENRLGNNTFVCQDHLIYPERRYFGFITDAWTFGFSQGKYLLFLIRLSFFRFSPFFCFMKSCLTLHCHDTLCFPFPDIDYKMLLRT